MKDTNSYARAQFNSCFVKQYIPLCLFAEKIVGDLEDATDIVQEAFLKLWEKNTFSSENSYLEATLVVTVRNRCIDFLRRRNSRTLKSIRISTSDEILTSDEESHWINSSLTGLLFQALDQLPLHLQSIIRKHYLEGKSYDQIAQEQDKTYKSVARARDRAIMRLKKLLH